jgi:hypothetical protein
MSIQRDGNFFYNRAAFEDQRPQHLPNQKSKVIYPQQPIDDKLVDNLGENFSPVHAPGAPTTAHCSIDAAELSV